MTLISRKTTARDAVPEEVKWLKRGRTWKRWTGPYFKSKQNHRRFRLPKVATRGSSLAVINGNKITMIEKCMCTAVLLAFRVVRFSSSVFLCPGSVLRHQNPLPSAPTHNTSLFGNICLTTLLIKWCHNYWINSFNFLYFSYFFVFHVITFFLMNISCHYLNLESSDMIKLLNHWAISLQVTFFIFHIFKI